tara:strand:+ start:237 stop:707 length:471 start_codon:yes stop_codon:yes gene_type:complete
MAVSKQEIVDYWATRVCESDLGTDFDEGATKCWCCGRFTRNLEKAHIVPKMLGGEYKVWNLILLCTTCHREAPDFDNPDYMWDWIKANSDINYDCYVTKRMVNEYEKMFGDLEFKGDEEKLKSAFKRAVKKSGWHGGKSSYATKACILKEAIEGAR